MPERVCIIAAMELKTTTKTHSSKRHNASISQLAANFVVARFDARSKAAIPAHSASRIAGFSTVTVSGATAAGLDRCAYTLGKWQNTIQSSATDNSRANRPEQISSHFRDIIKCVDSDSNQKVPFVADSVSDSKTASKESGNKKTALVVRFDRMEKRRENRKTEQKLSSTGQTQQRADAASVNVADTTTEEYSMAESRALESEANTSVNTAFNNSAAISETNYIDAELATEFGVDRRFADRREFTLQTMWHCLKNPRRSSGRRRTDNRYPLLDVFDSSAMFLAVALVTLSLCDAFFTLNILAHGGREVNPFMNYMLNFGTFAFVASKMLLTALAVVVMTAAGNLKIFGLVRVRSVIALMIGLYAGLIVYELLILAVV